MSDRFFLNLRYRNRLYRDNEGDMLDGEEAVVGHALSVAKDLIPTRTNIIRDWFGCSFEVTDETGRTVAVVPFGDTVLEADHLPC